MSLIDAALSRSRTVIAVLVLLLIAGFVAYSGIPKEARPDVNVPIIYVSMTHEGISPEDSERLLVRPMETELKSIEGIKEMRSNSYLGGGNVLLEFEAGFNAEKALNDVRERVDIAKAELPADADEPRVNEVNLSLFPIIVVTLGAKFRNAPSSASPATSRTRSRRSRAYSKSMSAATATSRSRSSSTPSCSTPMASIRARFWKRSAVRTS